VQLGHEGPGLTMRSGQCQGDEGFRVGSNEVLEAFRCVEEQQVRIQDRQVPFQVAGFRTSAQATEAFAFPLVFLASKVHQPGHRESFYCHRESLAVILTCVAGSSLALRPKMGLRAVFQSGFRVHHLKVGQLDLPEPSALQVRRQSWACTRLVCLSSTCQDEHHPHSSG
jgi:hypothetical protein